jgi:Mrp family chromosome partitioning ATPase
MERLQVAIEKARKQRLDKSTRSTAPRGEEVAKPIDRNALWAAPKPLSMRASNVRRNRLVALDGGVEAAPFDMLRTRILQQARQNDWRRIAIVSPHSACGKSMTVANLAFSFARQKDVRTLVMDFDLRRLGLSRMLGQDCIHTMADVLDGRVSFADHALRYGENVIFGLNNGPVSNPSEVLQSQNTAKRLKEIEAAYAPNIMLFDMPPLMGTDDSFGFLRNVDCALIMIEAEQTTTAQIDQSERQVAELTKVMGLVLNKCRYVDETHEYGYI